MGWGWGYLTDYLFNKYLWISPFSKHWALIVEKFLNIYLETFLHVSTGDMFKNSYSSINHNGKKAGLKPLSIKEWIELTYSTFCFLTT